MNKLVTLPHTQETIDISKILSISAVREDYKYVNPYIFRVLMANKEGEVSLIVGNDEYHEAQDDYGALMQAWQEFINRDPQ